MKNTIRNTVEEVYDTNVNNFKSNPSVSASKFVKFVPSETNIDKGALESNDVRRQNNGGGSFILIFFGMLLIAFLGLVVYFKDIIKPYLERIFESSLGKKNNATEKKEIDEETEEEETDAEEKEEEKDQKQPVKENKAVLIKKPSEDINKVNYSQNQIVKEDDMYCYVGEDDNMRQCIQVFKDEVCTSGDIFNRIDQCLVPKRG